jgi:phosphate transport system protein
MEREHGASADEQANQPADQHRQVRIDHSLQGRWRHASALTSSGPTAPAAGLAGQLFTGGPRCVHRVVADAALRLDDVRDRYHELLDSITDDLIEMNRVVGSMIQRATDSLLDGDLQKAESVITADSDIDAANRQVEAVSTDLIALQQPVATDLRIVVAAIRIAATLERMGDLARHIAKVARMRYPETAVPTEVVPIFREMGDLAVRMSAATGTVIADKDVSMSMQLLETDDRMDELHRQLFVLLLDDSWPYPVEVTIDITLLSRYYERFADHMVSIAKRVVFLTTGERVDEVV